MHKTYSIERITTTLWLTTEGIFGLPLGVAATFVFVFVILGSTDTRAPAGFAPIAIGLALTCVHLVGIPVTNMSVNPARSIGPALFVGGWALEQLWLFILIPVVGAILAGLVYRYLLEPEGA
jgi:aquaporin Z